MDSVGSLSIAANGGFAAQGALTVLAEASVERGRTSSPRPLPADRVTLNHPGFGRSFALFDLVGQSRDLAAAGRLHGSDGGLQPNAFPSGTLALASYLEALFPGALIPDHSPALSRLDETLSGATEPLSQDQLFNLVESLLPSGDPQSVDAPAAAPDPFYDDHDDDDPGNLVPIFVQSASFQKDGKDVPVECMELMSADDPTDCCVSDGASDAAGVRAEGRQDETYDVDVTWADGSFSAEQCMADEAVWLDLNLTR